MLWTFLIFEMFAWLPLVSAHNAETPFPVISFKMFSSFILRTFNPDISLASVLLMLFSLIENPELLNLHAKQKYPALYGEKKSVANGWIKALGKKIVEQLGNDPQLLFPTWNFNSSQWERDFALKLDGFIELLGLTPYDNNGNLIQKLKSVSKKEISPVYCVCPISMACTTTTCKAYHLSLATRVRDIPQIILIKGCTVFKNAYSLSGKCDHCNTLYSGDQESYQLQNTQRKDAYLNSARYLKIGQNLWVDRTFSNALLNGMYSFHASANAYVEYWNNSFGLQNPANAVKLSRRQIWQTFIQESIRTIASSSNILFEIDANAAIDHVTEQAFDLLGNNGLIQIASDHSCEDCSKPYKTSITDAGDPNAPVKLVVIDGIVMGPTVCYSFILLLLTKSP